MKASIILLALCLGSCGSANRSAEDAEQQYNIVSSGGTNSDICAAARKVADEWLRRGDREKFGFWRPIRDVDCDLARRDPQGMPSESMPRVNLNASERAELNSIEAEAQRNSH